MTEIHTGNPEIGEKINLARDLTPAEHHYFLGSSTEFMGTKVNTDSLPNLLNKPKFLKFFLKPLGIRSTASEEQIGTLNARRAQGLQPPFPLFLPQDRWEEFVNYNFNISLPIYIPVINQIAFDWPIQVFNSQGEQVDMGGVAEFNCDDPNFSIHISDDEQQLLARFSLQ